MADPENTPDNPGGSETCEGGVSSQPSKPGQSDKDKVWQESGQGQSGKPGESGKTDKGSTGKH